MSAAGEAAAADSAASATESAFRQLQEQKTAQDLYLTMVHEESERLERTETEYVEQVRFHRLRSISMHSVTCVNYALEYVLCASIRLLIQVIKLCSSLAKAQEGFSSWPYHRWQGWESRSWSIIWP